MLNASAASLPTATTAKLLKYGSTIHSKLKIWLSCRIMELYKYRKYILSILTHLMKHYWSVLEALCDVKIAQVHLTCQHTLHYH